MSLPKANAVFDEIAQQLFLLPLAPPYRFPFSLEVYVELCRVSPEFSFSVVSALPATAPSAVYAHMVQIFLCDMTEDEQLLALRLAVAGDWIGFMSYCASPDEAWGILPETAKLRRLMRFLHIAKFLRGWDWKALPAPPNNHDPDSFLARFYRRLEGWIPPLISFWVLSFCVLSFFTITCWESQTALVVAGWCVCSMIPLLLVPPAYYGLLEKVAWDWFVIRKWQWLSRTYPDILESKISQKWLSMRNQKKRISYKWLDEDISLSSPLVDIEKRWGRLVKRFTITQIQQMRLLAFVKIPNDSPDKLFSPEELDALTRLTPERIVRMMVAEMVGNNKNDPTLYELHQKVIRSRLSPEAAEAMVQEEHLRGVAKEKPTCVGPHLPSASPNVKFCRKRI